MVPGPGSLAESAQPRRRRRSVILTVANARSRLVGAPETLVVVTNSFRRSSLRRPDDAPIVTGMSESAKLKTRLSSTALLDAVLESPFGGLLPWITMALIAGPGRFEAAVSAAFAIALVLVVLRRKRGGGRIKGLESFDVVYFALFAIIGLFAQKALTEWLELWSGEIANFSLAAFVAGGLLLRRPFTLDYAKEQVEEQYWDSPDFRRVNFYISLVWGCSFLFSAVAGLVGNFVFHTANEFWTGWILQIGSIVFAVSFTEWFSTRAPAIAAAKAGGEAEPIPPLGRLFDWVPTFVIAIGVAGLVTDSTAVWFGVGAIVVGSAGASVFDKVVPKTVPQK